MFDCNKYYVHTLLRFGSDGGVPLKPPNLYPSLRVILAEKGTHYLGFSFKKMMFLCTLATKWAKISSIYSKITKLHPMFRDFSAKPYPMFRGFFAKKSPISAAHPRIPY